MKSGQPPIEPAGSVLYLRDVPADDRIVWLVEPYADVAAWMAAAAPDDARELNVWRVTGSYPMTVERRSMVRVQPYVT